MKTIVKSVLVLLFVLSGCKHEDICFNNLQSNTSAIDTTQPVEIDVIKTETEFVTVSLPEHELTTDELKQYTSMLEGYHYEPGKVIIDADDLANKLADKIVISINSGIENFNLNNALRLDTKSDYKNLKVYSFGYWCGGSRGYITFPIITWTDDSAKVKAFNLSKYINCGFTDVHKLSNDKILLLGDESGSGGCHPHIAYLIKFDKNHLNPTYPAFVNRPLLFVCNANFKFDAENQMLYTAKIVGRGNLNFEIAETSVYKRFAEDTIANRKLWKMLAPEYYEMSELHLHFQNGKFISKYKSKEGYTYE